MMRRSRIARGVLVVLAGIWMVTRPGAIMTTTAQSAWPFQLEWTETGVPATYYRLCVNGACTVLGDAHNTVGDTWRAALPLLPAGEYQLVVEACTETACVPGQPDLMIRVVPSTPRRPPIEVIDGPRIPLGR